MVALWSFSQWTEGLPPLRAKQVPHQTGNPPIQLSIDTRTKPFLKRNCPTMLFRVNTANWLFCLIKWDPAPKAAWANRAHKDQRENSEAGIPLLTRRGRRAWQQLRKRYNSNAEKTQGQSGAILVWLLPRKAAYPSTISNTSIILSVNNMGEKRPKFKQISK